MSKCFEEFYSELNSMNIQDINHALEEASKNLKKCTAPFEVRDIVEQQQEIINRQNAEIERLKAMNQSKLDTIYDLQVKIAKLKVFKSYFDELYGKGLDVANWHLNGALEPFDNFYESALQEMAGYNDV